MSEVFIGPYRILSRIAGSRMSTVYKAIHARTGDIVSLKTLTETGRSDPWKISCLKREWRCGRRFRHPNVARYMDTIPHDGGDCLVMEFIDGERLRETYRSRSLSVADRLEIARGICQGLQHIHECSPASALVYADLKPENILLRGSDGPVDRDDVVLIDFGAVIRREGKESLRGQAKRAAWTVLGGSRLVGGSSLYMSPEQCRADFVDPRADIYCLGAVLYELFTGRPPFLDRASEVQLKQGKAPYDLRYWDAVMPGIEEEIRARHLEEPPVPPRERNPAIPPRLSDIILRCLEKRPEDRFPSTLSVLVGLTQIQPREFMAQGAGQAAPEAGSDAHRSSTTTVLRMKAAAKPFSGRVNRKQLTQVTRQLAILLKAGLPVARTLRILEGKAPPGRLKGALLDVREGVEGGSSLSEAMALSPKVFDPLYVNMVRVGEAGGVLDVIFLRIADFMEKSQKLRQRVAGALIYPVLVTAIASSLFVLSIGFIIPKFERMFRELKIDLPLPTLLLIDLSGWMQRWILLIPLVPILLVAAVKWAGSAPRGRLAIDRLKLRIPLYGTILRKSATARFSRTLGTLISSGVPILEAVSIVKGTVGNAAVTDALGKVHDAIREGDTIAAPLRHSGCFDRIVVNMIEIGEETGDIDAILMKIADTYDAEVDAVIGGFLSLFEPLLIILMGIPAAFVIIALFLPLISVIENLGGAL